MFSTKDCPLPVLLPEDFEKEVKAILDAMGMVLADYNSRHRETVEAADGEYVIDVTARFTAFGVSYLTLVECKHYSHRKIERADVQVLYSKLMSSGAQKGIVFTNNGFQSGAIEFADEHGIALILLSDGMTSYFTRSMNAPMLTREMLPHGIPPLVGWLFKGNSVSLVSATEGKPLKAALFPN